MEKLVLTIEQCNHLKELGYDLSKSILQWYKWTKDEYGKPVNKTWKISKNDAFIVCNFETYEAIPTWTLNEIITFLPENIWVNDELYQLVITKNNIRYIYSQFNCYMDLFYNTEDENLLNSAYKVLCKLAEGNYLKK